MKTMPISPFRFRSGSTQIPLAKREELKAELKSKVPSEQFSINREGIITFQVSNERLQSLVNQLKQTEGFQWDDKEQKLTYRSSRDGSQYQVKFESLLPRHTNKAPLPFWPL